MTNNLLLLVAKIPYPNVINASAQNSSGIRSTTNPNHSLLAWNLPFQVVLQYSVFLHKVIL
jgi:hypothetical protein